MCRNIKTLFNFDPPATDEEIRAASVQFVRKLSGFTRPSQANEAVFEQAVDDVAGIARQLIDSLVTAAAPRDRAEWAARAKLRAAHRLGTERDECPALDHRDRRFGAAAGTACTGPALSPARKMFRDTCLGARLEEHAGRAAVLLE